MPPDERRQALIDATVPLLFEHGLSVTTRQVAEAAGVAEGTIFRAFASKDDLIHAAVSDALGRDDLAEALQDVPATGDVHACVLAIVEIAVARIERTRLLIALFHGRRSDTPLPHPPRPLHGPDSEGRCPRPDPRQVHARTTEALTRALRPHANALRTTPELAASTLLALTFGAHHPVAGDAAALDAATMTDLLLHGISKDAACC